jgi:hypothetical protein
MVLSLRSVRLLDQCELHFVERGAPLLTRNDLRSWGLNQPGGFARVRDMGCSRSRKRPRIGDGRNQHEHAKFSYC